MNDALYIGATGMQAQQLNVDTIANNLVNLNTPGFKKARVSFTDLMAIDAANLEGVLRGREAGMGPLASLQGVGAGVGVASLGKMFDQGLLASTGSMWDVGIQGDGFLAVNLADGSTGYARGGTLKVNRDGLLATGSGQPLKPGIAIPADATALAIAADGTVQVSVPTQTAPLAVGQIQVARFSNPSGLVALGDGLYKASQDSGEAMAGLAGQDGLGTLRQGYLEGSNVKMVDEMVNLMVAQRSYEANAKVVQASDELLGLVNNLRK